MAAVASAVCPPRNNVPPAVVLPEMLIHREGRVIPGQFAGEMGAHRNPMFVNYSRFNADVVRRLARVWLSSRPRRRKPQGFRRSRRRTCRCPRAWTRRGFNERLDLLGTIGHQQATLERVAENEAFDRYRQKAISLLADRQTQQAFNVADADPKAARPLRPQHVRLVAVDRPATGRGRREHGASQPGQRRNLGHARQRVSAS